MDASHFIEPEFARPQPQSQKPAQPEQSTPTPSSAAQTGAFAVIQNNFMLIIVCIIILLFIVVLMYWQFVSNDEKPQPQPPLAKKSQHDTLLNNVNDDELDKISQLGVSLIPESEPAAESETELKPAESKTAAESEKSAKLQTIPEEPEKKENNENSDSDNPPEIYDDEINTEEINDSIFD